MTLKKMVHVSMLFCFCILFCTGCKAGSSDENSTNYYSFTDSVQNTVILNQKPERVIALVGSYAETWILAGGELVGVTNDVISERQIDLNSKNVGTIKEPNIEEILALSPDFILLSSDIQSHIKISEILGKANIPYAFFNVEHFEDYLEMLNICTDITGNKQLYEKNGISIKKEIDTILLKVDKTIQPSILFIRAFSSGAKVKNDDNVACKILDDLGTINIASKHPSLLDDLSIEAIIEEDPDYIFVVTMGESSEKAMESFKNGIEKNPAWSNLQAVKNDRYIVLPKDLFHYKPNSRWGESYEYLTKILYPDNFK